MGARTAAAIIILTVFMLVGWILWVGTATARNYELASLARAYEELKVEHSHLQNEYSRLQNEYGVLKDEQASLAHEYENLKRGCEDLKREYESLKAFRWDYWDYEVLKSEYSDLQKEYLKLQEEYLSLKSIYESQITSLKANYSELEEKYEELRRQYEALRPSSWLSEDKRIKVTCELIPKYRWEKIDRYQLRVNVTNVGDEPLKKVLVFVFVYADGMLLEWEYYEFKDLYIGETSTYTFDFLPKELTSYRVLAVGGK